MTYRRSALLCGPPAFRTVADAQAWADLAWQDLVLLAKRVNALLVEARKTTGAALTAENAGTVNSGDGTTDDVIEANRTRIGEIEAILVANGLAT